jgi:hypothetical protein
MNISKSRFALLGLLALLLAIPPFARAADGWRYEVLAKDQTIKADAIKTQAYNELLEFKTIDVGGFKIARLFVQLLQSDFHKNQGKFTSGAKLRVSCFHNTKSGSSHFFEKEIPMTVTTYISGWVEIPIIGPDLRVVITGDNFPKTEMKANCTIYLLK